MWATTEMEITLANENDARTARNPITNKGSELFFSTRINEGIELNNVADKVKEIAFTHKHDKNLQIVVDVFANDFASEVIGRWYNPNLYEITSNAYPTEEFDFWYFEETGRELSIDEINQLFATA